MPSRLTAFWRRCILHECDHLDGILYVERVEGELHDNDEEGEE